WTCCPSVEDIAENIAAICGMAGVLLHHSALCETIEYHNADDTAAFTNAILVASVSTLV
ncbi:hypothetical protein LOAG_18981, partial [Loa loa]